MTARATNENAATVWLAALALALAVVAVYWNSLGGAFVFDDGPSISGNPTIRTLSWSAFAPPAGRGITVEGRPLLNASLALNYATGGTSPVGYHLVNLLIHLGATLALFGLARRTLRKVDGDLRAPSQDPRLAAAPSLHAAHATALAFAIALLWAVHPLQTESVTYVIQRAESLMGLWYVLALYCFVRGIDAAAGNPAASRRWFAGTIAAALAGAATKEVTVTLPLIVLVYDRTFVAGTFSAAWRARRGFYLGLTTLTWGLLAVLVLGSGGRGGTSGFGLAVAWGDYALTQFQAVCLYLWLSVWPSPLIFDYGTAWVGAVEAAPYALVVLALLAATIWALVRRPAWGFLGVWFFCLLAPTSLIPGNRQTLAEHRMYLPLAAVMTVAVVAGATRLTRRRLPVGRITVVAATVLALALGLATIRRNADYRTELGLYRDTVAKRPDNAFARHNFGQALVKAGAKAEAIAQFQAAVRLQPGWAYVHDDLGNALFDLRRTAEAEAAFRAAIRADPCYARAHYNLGNVLLERGEKDEALGCYRTAISLRPDFADARDNLGSLLLELGRNAEAAAQFEQVVAAGAANAGTYCNLGTAYLLLDRPREAIPQFEASLHLDPRLTPARERLLQARQALGPR